MSTVIAGNIGDKSFKTLVFSTNNKVIKARVQDGYLVCMDEPKDNYTRIMIKREGVNTTISSSVFKDGEWIDLNKSEKVYQDIDFELLRINHGPYMKWLMNVDCQVKDYPGLSDSEIKSLL